VPQTPLSAPLLVRNHSATQSCDAVGDDGTPRDRDLRDNLVGFLDREAVALLPDTARDAILGAARTHLAARVWFLHRDHLDLLTHQAFDLAYHEYHDILMHACRCLADAVPTHTE
jgi:hypothetical protein